MPPLRRLRSAFVLECSSSYSELLLVHCTQVYHVRLVISVGVATHLRRASTLGGGANKRASRWTLERTRGSHVPATFCPKVSCLSAEETLRRCSSPGSVRFMRASRQVCLSAVVTRAGARATAVEGTRNAPTKDGAHAVVSMVPSIFFPSDGVIIGLHSS